MQDVSDRDCFLLSIAGAVEKVKQNMLNEKQYWKMPFHRACITCLMCLEADLSVQDIEPRLWNGMYRKGAWQVMSDRAKKKTGIDNYAKAILAYAAFRTYGTPAATAEPPTPSDEGNLVYLANHK
jgi:hypothetical protein